jgi:hypothetical protein
MAHMETGAFRRLENVVVCGAGFTALAIFGLVQAVQPDLGLVQRGAMLALVCACGVLIVRCARMGVFVTYDRVVVRNIFRSYSIPWLRVRQFEMSSVFGVPAPTLTLVDDSKIRLSALSPPNRAFRPNNTDAERALAALEEARTSRVNR